MRIHPLITKSDDLKALVDRLSSQPFIAVDTEFMRENTYWPVSYTHLTLPTICSV